MANTPEVDHQCASILRDNKQLLLYPLCAALICSMLTAAIAFPTGAGDLFENVRFGRRLRVSFDSGLVAASLYLANHLVISFFSAAMVAASLRVLRGKETSFKDGFRLAFKRLPALLGWALISGTVGLVLRGGSRSISLFRGGREHYGGGILGWTMGVAWRLTTLFVIPSILVDDLSTVDAIKQSVELFKSKWKTSIFGYFGYVVGFGLLSMPAALMVMGGSYVGGIGGTVLVFVGVTYLACVAVSYKALESIWISVLFLYARTDRAPEGFKRRVLKNVFTA